MSQSKSEFYSLLEKQLQALLSGERDKITNMSQMSAFLNMNFEDINWVGFYLKQVNEELLLGPFQGNVACVRILMGKGVCGTAAQEQKSLVVDDVDSFDGHIACDSRSRSEVVCPIIADGQLIGVLDIDSPSLSRFDIDDAKGLERLLDIFVSMTDF